MKKPFKELNGIIKFGTIRFDCPCCINPHSIRVAINSPDPDGLNGGRFWTSTGDENNLTLSPSVNCIYWENPGMEMNKDSNWGIIDCTGTAFNQSTGCSFHGWVTDGQVVW